MEGLVLAERALFLSLLDLHAPGELEPRLRAALAALARATRATSAYLEIAGDGPAFTLCSDPHRETISRGVIGTAIAERQLIACESAATDPRLQHLSSI